MSPTQKRRSPPPPALLLLAAVAAGAVYGPSPAQTAVIPESQLRQALDQQRSLLAAAPDDAALWNDLGNLLMLGRRAAEAEEAYGRSLDLDPELVTARYNLALLYQETGRMARSKRELNRILKVRPDHAWARYFLGVALSEGGQRKAAIREFARAIRLEPDLTDPSVNPHVFDNELLAQAALQAYADLEGAELAPRLYVDRERVVRSMVRPGQIESTVLGPAPEPERAENAPVSGDEQPETGVLDPDGRR